MNTTLFRVISLCIVLTLTAVDSRSQSTYTLDPNSTFGGRGDGSIRPGDSIGTSPVNGNTVLICAQNGIGTQPGDLTAAPIQTNGFNQRGLSYDKVTGNLIFVDTRTGSGGAQVMTPNSAIYILDSGSGQIVGALNTNGIINDTGGIGCIAVTGVGDDGAIYVANQINSATAGNFKIYRWPTANPSAPNFNEAPTVAFSNKLEIAERLAQSIDVRGSGTNTQIIVGSSASNGPGTNSWIFTTADGTNFVQHRLYFPGIVTPNFNDGIAFGPGTNTFFAKQVGKPLLFLAWDPVTFVGSVINSYAPANPNDPLVNLSGITYDPATKLLGALEEIGGTATGGPGRVWLFDFPDPTNHAPAVLASSTYTPNFAKATAPMGYVKFGNGKLYANVVNNGMLVNNIDTAFLEAPTITTDLPPTNTVAVTLSAHFAVQAVYDVTNYQWYSNNIAVAGANNYLLDIPNITSSANGAKFQVVAFNAAGTTTSSTCTLKVVNPNNFFHLTNIWSIVATNFMTKTNVMSSNGGAGVPGERTVAYNAFSNQLLVVRGVSGTVPTVFVLDASTGNIQYTLKTNGVNGGQNLTLCGIGVAADGAVYACNTGSDANFKIYRWADSGSNTVAQLIFGTNSSAASANPMADQLGSTTFRFGDNLAVRGSGINTEILIDSQNSSKYFAVLHPLDSTMTNWSSSGYLLQNTPGSYGYEVYGTTIGRSLQFSPTSTFWQKRYNAAAGAPLAQMNYTAGGGLSTLASANTSLPIYTNGPVGINFQLNVAAAINFVGSVASDNPSSQDQLAYYDFTDPSQSVLLAQVNLSGGTPTLTHKGNQNAIGQVSFGTDANTGSNYLFVINGNNGLDAFALVGGAVPPPRFLAQPRNTKVLLNQAATLAATVDQQANITWYKGTNSPVNTGVTGNVYSIPHGAPTDEGDYFAVAANINGTVTSLVAHVTIVDAANFPTLNQVWAATAGNVSYLTNGGANTPSERTFAYNRVANQLVFVHCPPSSTAYALSVVDANTGSQLYTMNTSGVIHEGASEVAGSNPIDLVASACADDGALYIASETPNASGGLLGDTTKMMHVYRWADTAQNTAPTLIYEGDPSGQTISVNLRWGDVMAARGSGTNTELFLNAFEGNYGAILRPTNSTMTGFSNLFFSDSAGGGSIGRSVQFGPGNSVFEKRRGNSLYYSTYDLTNQTASVVFGAPSSSTLGAVAVDVTRNIAAGVDFVGTSAANPDAVALYDISDPQSPLLLARYNFPQGQVANANSICETLIVSNRVYALDGNNGFIAFDIVPPANVPPPVLSIALSGGNAIVSWPQQGSFTLQGVSALTGSPIPWSDIGTGTAVNGQYVVTNGISAQATFYRLRQ